MTATSKLIANIRSYFLGINELGLTSIFRGRPSSLPTLPSARIHHEDRLLELEYGTFNFTTNIVLQMMSESLDELDTLESSILTHIEENTHSIIDGLTDDTVGVYEFIINGIREDYYVESPEEEGRFFTVRPVVFSCSYYDRS